MNEGKIAALKTIRKCWLIQVFNEALWRNNDCESGVTKGRKFVVLRLRSLVIALQLPVKYSEVDSWRESTVECDTWIHHFSEY